LFKRGECSREARRGQYLSFLHPFPEVHITQIHIQGNERDSSRGLRGGLHVSVHVSLSLHIIHTHTHGNLGDFSRVVVAGECGGVGMYLCVHVCLYLFSVRRAILSVCRALLSGYRALFACLYVLESWMRACVCM